MVEEHKSESMRIILVDDEKISHQTLGPYLRDLGHVVENAYDGTQGMNMIAARDYDLALIDVRMPGMDGLELLAKVGESHPDLAVVMITGHGVISTAIQALRLGAADFLTKPVKLLELDAVLEKSCRARNTQNSLCRPREISNGIQMSACHPTGEQQIIRHSKAMKDVQRQLELAVEADCETILITGETGTGKELVAREIHLFSEKQGSPFVAVSCPAVPEMLVESELFGHRKGAFTGAMADRPGYFELADGGTLFLDEVADLSQGAQAKILRALETRTIRRVGGIKEIEVNVRVVAATNKPLEELVHSGKFRQDLYYRLKAFTIDIPPLRARPEAIVPLAEHFLQSFSTRKGFALEGFSEQAKELLLAYEFPGNVRELKNLVERAAILCRSRMLEPHHLNLPESTAQSQSSLLNPHQHQILIGRGVACSAQNQEICNTVAENTEQTRILEALRKTNWNRRKAAEELGMSYSTIRYKINKYDIK